MATASLTIGPVLFNWSPDEWRDFYARIADEAPAERVCVGEVVCSKRLPFVADMLGDVVERLQNGGKQVILSSLALPTLARERNQAEELLAIPGVMVEANDVSALPPLAGHPHAIGPLINVYNEGTLSFLAKNGATRICLPPELPRTSIAAIAGGVPEVAVEVWAFGRVPLAISARCYHARVHNLHKDSCQFVCGQDADGLAVETLDGRDFLAINGLQTLSHTCCNLSGEMAGLVADGVEGFRLSPHACDMVAVTQHYRDMLDGRMSADEASAKLAELVKFAPFSNGFVHAEPGWQLVDPAD
ncbi:MAG: U32 family peptidase [Alphaproteobacteria bacterium]